MKIVIVYTVKNFNIVDFKNKMEQLSMLIARSYVTSDESVCSKMSVSYYKYSDNK